MGIFIIDKWWWVLFFLLSQRLWCSYILFWYMYIPYRPRQWSHLYIRYVCSVICSFPLSFTHVPRFTFWNNSFVLTTWQIQKKLYMNSLQTLIRFLTTHCSGVVWRTTTRVEWAILCHRMTIHDNWIIFIKTICKNNDGSVETCF